MNSNPHPTRSPEFLSRLHDGELSPAERAHFESHRAHCSECRTAAAQFEAALTLYRTSIPSPAAPDLASRILRKLQTNDSLGRRQRFGPTFGIDLRWAGAFAAAVIAAIIGSSIVAKNEARERLAASPAVPIALENRPAAPPAPEFSASRPAAAPAPPARRFQEEASKTAALERDERPRQSGAAAPRAGEPPDSGAVDRNAKLGAATSEFAYSPQKTEERAQRPSEAAGVAVDGLVAEKKRERAAAPAPQAAAAAPPQVMKSLAEPRADAPASANERLQETNAQNSQNSQNQNVQPRDADRPGGEGGNAADSRQTPALRLVVSALDGGPSAPDLLPPSGTDLPAGLRGQQFVVMVDAAGHVREVRPWPTLSSGRRSNETSPRAKDKEAPSPLLMLRFQPGDSPRRLLVRVE